jgi:hypothetical protein
MFDFKITPDEDDPYEVTAGSRDVLVFEKTNRGTSISSLLTEQKMGDLYKLAHIASRRQGLFDGSLAEFEKTCELKFTEETEEPDPTQPAP